MKTKEEKRAEAAERQAVHDGLSTMDKLGKLAARRGESKRERARLIEGLGE